MANIRKPRVVAFEVTRKCKMNCIHCRASAKSDFLGDLSTDQCKKIIKSIADYNKCVLIFTGGEPFERNDIFELIDFANSCGLALSLATCGYNFDEEKAQKLKKAGVLTLSFSLDSDDAKQHDNFRQTQGAFEKTLSAINIAKNAGLKFQINTTVTKLNADKLPQIARLAESLGAYCFNPFMLVPAGRGKEIEDIALSSKEYEKTLNTVAKLKNENEIEVRFTCAPRFSVIYSHLAPATRGGVKLSGCLAASDFTFISYAGDVQTCGFLNISAGNNILEKGDFGSIWEKSVFLNSIRQKKFIGKCGDCNFVNICGGCRARAFAQTGDYLTSDPLCSYRLALPSQWQGSEVSSLIAAHIEDDRIAEVAGAVNALPNVSHNYLRKHYYNLWFTLKAPSLCHSERTPTPLCHSERSPDLSGRSEESRSLYSVNPCKSVSKIRCKSVSEILNDLSQKFNTSFYSFPSVARYKLDKSAIKKHNPPENYNALFCCDVKGEALKKAIKYLCDLPQVSHCYERKRLTSWPYNIYAMIHEKNEEQIDKIAAQFITKFNIKQFQILPTVKSLKKT